MAMLRGTAKSFSRLGFAGLPAAASARSDRSNLSDNWQPPARTVSPARRHWLEMRKRSIESRSDYAADPVSIFRAERQRRKTRPDDLRHYRHVGIPV